MALRSLFLPVLFVLNLCCLFQETAAKRITKTGYLLHQQLSKVTPVAQGKSDNQIIRQKIICVMKLKAFTLLAITKTLKIYKLHEIGLRDVNSSRAEPLVCATGSMFTACCQGNFFYNVGFIPAHVKLIQECHKCTNTACSLTVADVVRNVRDTFKCLKDLFIVGEISRKFRIY